MQGKIALFVVVRDDWGCWFKFVGHFEVMSRNESLYDCCFLFSDFEDIPLTAAQDLGNILKQGYLEKKRRGISNGGHLLLAAEVGAGGT